MHGSWVVEGLGGGGGAVVASSCSGATVEGMTRFGAGLWFFMGFEGSKPIATWHTAPQSAVQQRRRAAIAMRSTATLWWHTMTQQNASASEKSLSFKVSFDIEKVLTVVISY